jgi:hypothetical protein
MTEFLNEKREIYLLQMMIDRQRNEISKIDRDVRATERSLVDQEESISFQSKRCKAMQAQNENTLRRVLRRTERAVQQRVALQTQLRRGNARVALTKSEIANNQDQLHDFHVYRDFLRLLTPDDQEPHEYFDSPKKIVQCLDSLEQGNLIAIQACRYFSAKLQRVEREFGRGSEEFASLIAEVEGDYARLTDVEELPDTLSAVTLARGRATDNEYERVRALVVRACANCLGEAGDAVPIAMLRQIENRLEAFYQKIDRIRPDFVAAKQAQRTILRREQHRVEQQAKQAADLKIKTQHALYRATRPIQLRTGRPLYPRTLPRVAAEAEDREAALALKEQQRIDELLYTDNPE